MRVKPAHNMALARLLSNLRKTIGRSPPVGKREVGMYIVGPCLPSAGGGSPLPTLGGLGGAGSSVAEARERVREAAAALRAQGAKHGRKICVPLLSTVRAPIAKKALGGDALLLKLH